jgi:endonuclease YncB( thermonuclease family)
VLFEERPAAVAQKIDVVYIHAAARLQHTKPFTDVIVPVPFLKVHEDDVTIDDVHAFGSDVRKVVAAAYHRPDIAEISETPLHVPDHVLRNIDPDPFPANRRQHGAHAADARSDLEHCIAFGNADGAKKNLPPVEGGRGINMFVGVATDRTLRLVFRAGDRIPDRFIFVTSPFLATAPLELTYNSAQHCQLPNARCNTTLWRRLSKLMPVHLTSALLFTLLLALGVPAAAQKNDTERKIRNVTPENIPVIILPPRNDTKGDFKSQQNLAPISGDDMKGAVSEDGAVTANGKPLTFSGVTLIPNDTLCTSEKTGRWACGLRAYVSLRNLVHGKEIRCDKLAERDGIAVMRCHRERTNISEWLLAEGWALYDETTGDDALAAAAQDAQKKQRGIWANSSRPLTLKK